MREVDMKLRAAIDQAQSMFQSHFPVYSFKPISYRAFPSFVFGAEREESENLQPLDAEELTGTQEAEDRADLIMNEYIDQGLRQTS